MIKKRQHYVYREYLRAWSTNEKIWCNRKGHIFQPNLMGIAQENYFYKLREITEDQVKAIQTLYFRDSDPTLQAMNQWWINVYMLIFRLRQQIEQAEGYSKHLEDEYNRIHWHTVFEISQRRRFILLQNR
jgi:hypothetical protein